MNKTNVMRLLEAASIQFRTMEYEVDENDLSGVHVANQLGQPVEQVFKTLVVQGEKQGYMVCCIPVAEELDLKKVAKVAGDKKVEMLPMKELLGVTGYVRGGCSPIGMKKEFETVFDQSSQAYSTLLFSAGKRGISVEVDPQEIKKIINYKIADIATS